MKINFGIFIFICTIFYACDGTNRNKRLIQGSWKVASLNDDKIAFTNYGDGGLQSGSIVTFRGDSFEIIFSDSTETPEVFKYRIDGNQLIVLYSDYGIPFQIQYSGKDEMNLTGTGYGNTEQQQKIIKKIMFTKIE